MAKFIKHREYIDTVEYRRLFQLNDAARGTGYSFPCSQDGTITEAGHALRAQDLAKDSDYTDMGVEKFEHSYRQDAVIECNHCQRHIELSHHMTNECECGAFYNGSGQELSHPSQWGEETGERFDNYGNPIL